MPRGTPLRSGPIEGRPGTTGAAVLEHPMDTVKVPVGDLRPHPANPKTGDVETIKESIRTNGLYRPIFVQASTGYVLAGNHTLQAAVEVGLAEVPVIYLDVDEEQALRILLVDNRSADLGRYDNRLLADLLSGLAESELALVGTGWQDRELLAMLEQVNTELAPVDPQGRPVTGGLVWQVIIDCRDGADQAELIDRLQSEGRACRAVVG